MKLKSHSGTKKRVKVTARGKFKFDKAARRHLLINKNKRQKKLHPRGLVVPAAERERISRLLPYA